MEREGIMDIGIAIQDFITVHEIENHSPYTIRNYRRHLVFLTMNVGVSPRLSVSACYSIIGRSFFIRSLSRKYEVDEEGWIVVSPLCDGQHLERVPDSSQSNTRLL